MRALATGLLVLSFAVGSAVLARAQSPELFGPYATTKAFCKDKAMQVFRIKQGVVDGPNFRCTIQHGRPVASGIHAFEAKCTQGDKAPSGVFLLDLGNRADHIKISLPIKQDWITLYLCK
jgi:hypothetical protein